MKSLAYFLGSNVFDSYSNETVEKALDSIVENASKYRELMGTCDPHGLAFGRQLIERKNGNRGQIMFSIAQQQTTNKPFVRDTLPDGSRQEASHCSNTGHVFLSNAFKRCEEHGQASFKDSYPPNTLLGDFMLESKQRAISTNNRSFGSTVLQHETSLQSNKHKASRSIAFDMNEDFKASEKRKFQEETTAVFFSAHKRLLVAGPSEHEQSLAPKTFQNEQKKSKRKLVEDKNFDDDFSLPASIFSKQNTILPDQTSLNDSHEKSDLIHESLNESDATQGEAPVRNSIFWLHRSFPHLD